MPVLLKTTLSAYLKEGAINEDTGYVLPIATSSTLGGVKIGENLLISEDGVLTPDYSTLSTISYVDNQLSLKADKATTLVGYGITDAYTSQEIDTKVDSINSTIEQLNTKINKIESSSYIYTKSRDEFISDFYLGNQLSNGNYISLKENGFRASINNNNLVIYDTNGYVSHYYIGDEGEHLSESLQQVSFTGNYNDLKNIPKNITYEEIN